MPQAQLHDGSLVDVAIQGDGPTVLIPVNPRPVEGPQADEMRKWGADPALGRSLIDGLSDAFRVVAADYEGHVLAAPKPDTLTPDNVANRTYPLIRDAYFYVNKAPGQPLDPKVREFMRFVLSREGQEIIAKVGYFYPLNKAYLLEQRKKLD